MGLRRSCVVIIWVSINLIILSCGIDGSYTSASTAGYRRAKTMANWVYSRVPRVEALIIKLQGRSLYPGDLNCWNNLISVEEFSSEFLIYFPTAREGSTYSIVIYSDTEVFYVKYGITAETIFRGIKGPNSSVKNMLVNFFGFKKVHVIVFEENPHKTIKSLDPASLKIGFGLHALETTVANTLGIAGRACMELLADSFKITPRPRAINHEFQKVIDTAVNGW